jgi:hypothetical protein
LTELIQITGTSLENPIKAHEWLRTTKPIHEKQQNPRAFGNATEGRQKNTSY